MYGCIPSYLASPLSSLMLWHHLTRGFLPTDFSVEIAGVNLNPSTRFSDISLACTLARTDRSLDDIGTGSFVMHTILNVGN
jgi:hypothetical protein